jgi:hypothetical protein
MTIYLRRLNDFKKSPEDGGNTALQFKMLKSNRHRINERENNNVYQL